MLTENKTENKTEVFMVRATPTQAAAIRAAAAEDGERPATWIRQTAVRQARQVTTDWAA